MFIDGSSFSYVKKLKYLRNFQVWNAAAKIQWHAVTCYSNAEPPIILIQTFEPKGSYHCLVSFCSQN